MTKFIVMILKTYAELCFAKWLTSKIHLRLISSRDHFHRISPSQNFDTPREVLEIDLGKVFPFLKNFEILCLLFLISRN